MSNVNVEDLITVPKTEHSEDGSFSETSLEPDEQSFIQESAQVQKRKGGRKPVWMMAELLQWRDRNVYSLTDCNQSLDICHIRRTKAKEPPGTSCF